LAGANGSIMSYTSLLHHAVKKIYHSKISQRFGISNNPQLILIIKKIDYKWQYTHAKIKSRKLQNKFNQMISTGNLCSGRYKDLDTILHYDVDLFKVYFREICEINLNNLNKKIKTNIPIKIYFFVNVVDVWSCHNLYQLFENDTRFEPTVIVPGFNNGTKITIRTIYEDTLSYFKEHGYRTIGVWDMGAEKNSWEEIGIPDIVFHLTPYITMLPEKINISTLPLSVLNINIPYALASGTDAWWYNTPGARLSWKQFVEAESSSKVIKKYLCTGNENVVVSGHPKTDEYFIQKKKPEVSDFWKIPKGVSPEKIIKIIYAPHHSIYNYSINFSTFHQNYYAIYQYALSHPSTTSWIIKPHPLLKKAAVELGLFKDETAYDEYMDLWDALPNARTVRSGEYVDIFLTSDAMITDSGSFIIEYQYVQKPLIVLTRPERKFNDLSSSLLPGLYLVNGEDINMIYSTINSVLLEHNDYLKETRDKLFTQYLDIMDITENRAPSDYIYTYILRAIQNDDLALTQS
jgi:hypothetical protein